jgi:hypothetical protein
MGSSTRSVAEGARQHPIGRVIRGMGGASAGEPPAAGSSEGWKAIAIGPRR